MKLRHESVVLKDLTKEERLAIRKASMTAGDSWEDLHGTKDRPEKQTFRGHLNDGLSSRHNVDDSQAAEDAAKEAAMIPIMQNTKELQEGDELVVYKEESLRRQTLAPASTPNAAPSAKKRAMPPAVKRLNQPKKKGMKH